MLYSDKDFVKRLDKKAQKNSVLFDYSFLSCKKHLLTKVSRVNNVYSETKLNKALDLLEENMCLR